MTIEKPYSAACERNQAPILAVLQRHVAGCRHALEIGSGTGQHAVHFARALPQLIWQPSDRPDSLPGIHAWRDEAALPNLRAPLQLDVTGVWPQQAYDLIYSANTLHIMAWPEVEQCFRQLPTVMAPEAWLVIYGPFKYGGRHTSDSNAAFDEQLRQGAPHRGLRDIEAVEALARAIGLRLHEDVAMPANNRCLVWRRMAA